ncbi:ArsR/SmtB family transcription factor [Microbacterium gorillae]|uniref:ArsR/SmtB family transcription factor n=1 Tax=Microbacterium gorillae TaxID=1231063 RepID=UPI00058C89FF|nr:metalloregulator ArsR/SmtB family transcription factor [Microbacterium gorillae]
MADIFDVIADGTRREILRLLLDRSAMPGYSGTSVSHIVADLGVSQPTVSKHLKVLREANLVSVREDGQHRFYSLHVQPLEDIEDWLMPFVDIAPDEDQPALPDGAVHAADFVGRAAASVTHAVTAAFRKRPGAR